MTRDDVPLVRRLHDITFPRRLAWDERAAARELGAAGRRGGRSTWVAYRDGAFAGFVLAFRFGAFSALRAQLERECAVVRASVSLGRPRPRTLGVPLLSDVWEAFDNAATRGALTTSAEDRYVSALAVEGRARRRGVGRALLDVVIGEALSSGAGAVWLHCWDGADASGFYARQGFLPIVRIGPHYDDRSPATLMALELAR